MIALVEAFLVGCLSGFGSGLTGVSAGGGLVIFSALLLGADQHMAQGLSLIAQIPPTSLLGVRRYRKSGHQIPLKWIGLIVLGLLLAGPLGALAANHVSSFSLRFTFIVYLCLLALWLQLRTKVQTTNFDISQNDPGWAKLLSVGLVAGFSSGYLGIGGGLAITVCLSAWLGVPQIKSQMVSLMVLLVPTTLPAALVYVREGKVFPVSTILAVILGLWCGADVGARAATRLKDHQLRRAVIGYILFMAIYMAFMMVTEPSAQ